MPFTRCIRDRARDLEGPHAIRNVVPTNEREPDRRLHEHRREVATERLGRRLRSGVVLAKRSALPSSDAIRAKPRCTRARVAFLEALGVAQRERREGRERVEELRIGG